MRRISIFANLTAPPGPPTSRPATPPLVDAGNSFVNQQGRVTGWTDELRNHYGMMFQLLSLFQGGQYAGASCAERFGLPTEFDESMAEARQVAQEAGVLAINPVAHWEELRPFRVSCSNSNTPDDWHHGDVNDMGILPYIWDKWLVSTFWFSLNNCSRVWKWFSVDGGVPLPTQSVAPPPEPEGEDVPVDFVAPVDMTPKVEEAAGVPLLASETEELEKWSEACAGTLPQETGASESEVEDEEEVNLINAPAMLALPVPPPEQPRTPPGHG